MGNTGRKESTEVQERKEVHMGELEVEGCVRKQAQGNLGAEVQNKTYGNAGNVKKCRRKR